MKTYIHYEPHGEYAWVCLCGNTAQFEGFYPSTKEGKFIEDDSEYYCCDRCGRIIIAATREIIGRKPTTQ